MTKDEAMKQALEALRTLHDENMDYLTRNKLGGENNQCMVFAREAITALRQAIEQAQQAEPVVGVFDYKEHAEGLQRDYDLLLAEYNDLKAQQAEPVIDKSAAIRIATALGWTPPREWVGLTPQERDEINEKVYGAVPHHVAFHHAIEAKLKEKDT